MRVQPPGSRRLLGLAALLVVAGLLAQVRARRPAPGDAALAPNDARPAQDEPAPAVDGLVSIGLPQSQLVLQNLEPDRPIDLAIDLRRADGSTAAQLRVDGLPPLAPRVLALAELPNLPVGVYGAVVQGSGRVAALARHAWPRPDDARVVDLAIAAAGEPARDLVLPYLAFSGSLESAVLSLQNSDLAAAARVDLALIPFDAAGAAPAWEGALALAAGGSASLDLAGPGFESLAGGFRGFARIRADRPVTAAGLLVLGKGSAKAAAALEARPAEAAAPSFLTGFVTRIGGDPSGSLSLVNPSSAPQTLRLRFRPDDPAHWRCEPEAEAGITLSLAAGAGMLVNTDERLLPALRPDCVGLVEGVGSGAGVVAASMHLTDGSGSARRTSAAAYALSGRPATRLALPWLADAQHLVRWVWAVNPGAAAVRGTIEARDAAGRPFALGGSTLLEVPAGRSASLALAPDRIVEPLAGLLQADGPVEALLSETAGGDVAAYAALDPEAAGPSAFVPLLARPPSWPTRPAFSTPAPEPSASPTRVTVVPPAPRAEPTLAPPARLARFDLPRRADWVACCAALAWPRPEEIWGVDFGDGVPLDLARFDARTGEPLPAFDGFDAVELQRLAMAPSGEVLALTGGWASTILRLDLQGRVRGKTPLPVERDWELADLAAAPDGTIWLVDNQRYEVHHLEVSGNHLASWPYFEALRHPGDGGYRIAVSPRGDRVWVLSWARLMGFSIEGRLVTAIGAPTFELGPEDFRAPMDLAVDAAGRVYVIEGTGRLRVFEPDGWELARWQAFEAPAGAGADGGWLRAALALGPGGALAVSALPDGEGAEGATDGGSLQIFAPLDAAVAGPTPTRGAYRGFLPAARAGD
ncbi:MAG: hypothetical protein KDH92_01485 [Chloroflexi bacterium]|nr:hypothetical protein [Chloroflexota bacterium]